uniref:Uncharacterized protein n=1 Tax=Globisporangium ultimum (strain ATCC 200006 / CBS 805.95 / DAOM BR144) TaxID=431595 RepID=K3WYT7_GLOUD
MGAAPSLAKLLKSMEDEELTRMVEDAYHLDPQRIERVLTAAKLRYVEHLTKHGDSLESSSSAATTAALSATFASAPSANSSTSAGPPAAASNMDDALPPPSSHSAAADDPVLNDKKDPMNALWSFEGHTLRELQPAEKNPQHSQQQLDGSDGSSGVAPAAAKELDDDGYPILYGSCGRDKRYARCSVCYFRGLRCNSAHYCNCCQRPVCIRPRKYPGEDDPKICWNVLHMDKDMVHRVEKKKRRRLQAAAASSVSAGNSGAAMERRRNSTNSNSLLALAGSNDVGAGAASVADSGGNSPPPSMEDASPGTTPPAESGAAKQIVNI